MEITYTKKGDYYIPNLYLEKGKNDDVPLGKYGREKLKYLKQNKKAEYLILFMDNELKDYLIDIDNQANMRAELLINQMKEAQNVTEELKEKDQLKWVGLMNNIQNSVDEIIRNEFIYN